MSLVVFKKDRCVFCHRTLELLKTKVDVGVPIHVINVSEHPERRSDLTARGLTTVPQLFLNGALLEGGNAGVQQLEAEGKLDDMLAAAALPTAEVSSDGPAPLLEGGVLQRDGTVTAPAPAPASDSDAAESESDEEDSEVVPLPAHPTAKFAVYVLHDNDKWMTPYRASFLRAGVPFVEWRLGSGVLDLAGVPPQGVFFNRTSVSSHTRGDRYSLEHAQSVVAWLEAHGRTVVGGTDAMGLEMSKARQVVELARDGVASPHTTVVVGQKRLAAAIKHSLHRSSHGVIVKPNRGGSGAGVRLIRDMAQARRYLQDGSFDGSLDDTLLIQDFIPSPEAVMHRLEFVNGRNLYAVKVDTSHVAPPAGSPVPPTAAAASGSDDLSNCPLGEEAPEPSFSNCPADSCNLDDSETAAHKFNVDPDFNHEVIGRLESFLRRHPSVGVAGIEVVVDAEGKAWVIDANVVNSNMNRAAELRAGMDVSGVDRVVEYLLTLMPAGWRSSSSSSSSSPPSPTALTKAGAGSGVSTGDEGVLEDAMSVSVGSSVHRIQ